MIDEMHVVAGASGNVVRGAGDVATHGQTPEPPSVK